MKFSSLRGKVVYVDFWATWCAPCRVSLPLLNRLRNDLSAQGLEVVGINVDEDPAAARRVVQEAGVAYPMLRGTGDEIMLAYGVEAMPSAYLIDRSGKVRSVHPGFRESQFAGLRTEIEKLLREERK